MLVAPFLKVVFFAVFFNNVCYRKREGLWGERSFLVGDGGDERVWKKKEGDKALLFSFFEQVQKALKDRLGSCAFFESDLKEVGHKRKHFQGEAMGDND